MQRKTMFESAVREGWRVSSVLITAKKEVHAIFLNTMYCFQYCTWYVFIPYISLKCVFKCVCDVGGVLRFF